MSVATSFTLSVSDAPFTLSAPSVTFAAAPSIVFVASVAESPTAVSLAASVNDEPFNVSTLSAAFSVTASVTLVAAFVSTTSVFTASLAVLVTVSAASSVDLEPSKFPRSKAITL